MKLTKLTQKEAFTLQTKVGDLTGFKAKILQSRLNLDAYELYKDEDTPLKAIYIALSQNPRFQKKETGLYLARL